MASLMTVEERTHSNIDAAVRSSLVIRLVVNENCLCILTKSVTSWLDF